MTIRTPSQTIGPFFHVGLKWEDGHRVALEPGGEKVVLTGTVYDGAGALVADALVETWQADPGGNVPGTGAGPKPQGYGRSGTDRKGKYLIETSMPGARTASGGDSYVPQIHVTIFARGLLKAVRTRVFLASPDQVKDDPLGRAAGGRASTLIALRDGSDRSLWRWDIRLQGKGETVFIEA